MTDLHSILKSRDIANKGPSSQSYDFFSSHVWMLDLDYKESWAPKNWCFWTVMLEKTIESPLDCKEIQPVHPKEDQSWVFIGRTDIEAETPRLWPPDAKGWLIWKDPDAGQDWGREEKGQRRQWQPTPVLLHGRLQSMESQRVGHNWAASLSLFTFMHWRRKWQPIPVFLPGESQGWQSLVGCSLWGRTRLKWFSSSSSVSLC